MKSCPTVAKATAQRVIAVLEDVSGQLQAPEASGYILPAGRASMTQSLSFSDSEELSSSLNKLEQFQNAVEAGTGTIPLYGRLDAAYGKPEGDALFQALMGDYNDPAHISCVAASEAAAEAEEIAITQIVNGNSIDGNILAGKLPPRGVLIAGSEKILYREIKVENGQTILGRLKRGYGNTEKGVITDGASLQLLSRVYTQSTCRPTLSIYMLNDDKLCLFMSGCSVTKCAVSLQRQAGQMFSFDFQGRKMGWCGSGILAQDSTGNSIKLEKGGAAAFTPGGYIRNASKGESVQGWLIRAVDDQNDVLTLSGEPADWKAGDIIRPWLPETKPIGQVLEARFANVEVAQVAGKMTEGELNIETPVSNLAEIGEEYVGEGIDGRRTITLERSIYFREQDCREFGKGYKGYELPVTVFAGKEPGLTLGFYMPRMKFGTPELNESDSVLMLRQNGAALGVTGEDELFIIQE